MSNDNFENMTLDELTAFKSGIKAQIDALHLKARSASEVQNRLIEQEHIDRARESMQAWADKNGKTLDEAIEYWMGRLTENGDPGRWVQAKLLSGQPGKAFVGGA